MKKRGDGPPESVDKGTLATLRREGQAQFTCAAKPRSERAFTKTGLAGFVISLRGDGPPFLFMLERHMPGVDLLRLPNRVEHLLNFIISFLAMGVCLHYNSHRAVATVCCNNSAYCLSP